MSVVEIDQALHLESDGRSGYRVLNAEGCMIGVITRRHAITRELADGKEAILHVAAYSVEGPCERYPHGEVRIRIVLGQPNETYVPRPKRAVPRSYPTSIVGESFYQDAISRCREGDRVALRHEPDNPYDSLAIAVCTARGEKIGHIARDSWLRDAIHRDGQGVSAFILGIHGPPGRKGVVLQIALDGTPIERRPTQRRGEIGNFRLMLFLAMLLVIAIIANARQP